MRLFLFLILLSTSCFAQRDSLENRFFSTFKVDSLIRGDWKLIETHVNNQPVKQASKTAWMKITKDSLFQFHPSFSKLSSDSPDEFIYSLNKDQEPGKFKLDIFQKKRKKYTRYNQFTGWFRNLDELIISSDTHLDDGIGHTPLRIIYVFKRAGESSLDELLANQKWFYSPDENKDFLNQPSDQLFTFRSDTIGKSHDTNSQKCLNFTKSMYQTEWSTEKTAQPFESFFGSDATVFWSEKHRKIYFFSGSQLWIYTIVELNPEKLVLKQDRAESSPR